MDLKDIENATVTITKLGGRGVLIGNNMILTAAHCIDFEIEGGMVLGDFSIEEVKAEETLFRVAPLYVEPISDLAVLGTLDEQTFFKDATDFENFCDNTKPIKISQIEIPINEKIPIHIYTHKETWIHGTGEIYSEVNSPHLWLETEKPIEGGTSGSPIVDDIGNIVGIVSNTSNVKDDRPSDGRNPRPLWNLPMWIIHDLMLRLTPHI